MGVGLGLTGFLGIGQESTYGTPVARTNFFEINDEGLAVEEGRIESAALAQVGIRNTKLAQGGITVGGDFSMDVQYGGMERLFKHAFGSISSSRPDPTNAPTVWRHTFSIADALPTGLTVEVFRGTEDFVTEPSKSFIYHGCLITSLNLSCGVDDLLKASFSLMGEDESRLAKSTPSYDASKLAVYHQGVVKWNTTDVEVSSFSLDINNALEYRPKLGSRLTRQPKRSGKLEVAGQFTAEFTGWEQYDDFRNMTERVLTATFTGDTIAAGFTYELLINIPIGIINSARVVLDQPGRLMMEIGFKAYRTDSAGELTLRLQNITTASLAN